MASVESGSIGLDLDSVLSLTNVRDSIAVLGGLANNQQFVTYSIAGCSNCESRGRLMGSGERKDLSKAEWKVVRYYPD
jgi:hypothetical protein